MLKPLLVLLIMVFAAGAEARFTPPSIKPERPASPYIAQDQAVRLRGLFEALDARDYDEATTFLFSIEDPLARRIGTWAILASNADGLTLNAYAAFLDQNPGWPNPITLQRKAENLIDDDIPPDLVLSFFAHREPVSGFGKLHLARALFAAGRTEAGRAYLKKAWIEHNFTSRDSREIVELYGEHLTAEDHFAKADRTLFLRSTAGTEDVEGLLTGDRAAEVAVRSDLIRGRARGLDRFNRLSEASKRDPGVLHAMTRYLRRADREEDAIEIAALAPTTAGALRDPRSWYYERRLLARWALKEGRFEDAYNLSAYSGLTEGADFAEAEFMAGWLALRFLGDANRARAHFAFLTENVSTPISLARGNYWLGRSYAALGDEVRARAHYTLAGDHPYTYYGQLAIEEMGGEAPRTPFPAPQEITEAERGQFEQRELTKAVRILDRINQDITYRRFALALDDQLASEGEVKLFAEMVRKDHQFDLIVRAGKGARSSGAAVPEVIYPLYPVPAQARDYAEEALILGLSRQESEFRVDAYSSAHAKGMMQLLDSTARLTARKEGFEYEPLRLLTDPAYNMVVGSMHLSHLLERFGGSYVMVLAAYNAGPHRVDSWVKDYGDPRDPDIDPVDWVELIPFSETRNYVMRVLENTQVYRSRIEGSPLGRQLAEDLTRGSVSTLAAIGQPRPVPALFEAAAAAGPPILTEPGLGGPPLALSREQVLTPGVPSVRPAPVSNR